MDRLLLIGLFGCLFASIDSLKFKLQPNTQKCLKEEIKQNVLVIGEYDVQHIDNQRVDYVVTDSKKEVLSRGDSIAQGKFSLVVDSHEVFEVCFMSKISPGVSGIPQDVTFTSKIGEEAKTFEGMGEAQKMKPMEVELKKLEVLSHEIVEEFQEMRNREIKMSDTNESTNSRVLYLSIFSMCCLLCLSVWQVLYLRKYFKSRKLIE